MTDKTIVDHIEARDFVEVKKYIKENLLKRIGELVQNIKPLVAQVSFNEDNAVLTAGDRVEINDPIMGKPVLGTIDHQDDKPSYRSAPKLFHVKQDDGKMGIHSGSFLQKVKGLDEASNPHVSKDYPGKLEKKIDLHHNGKYHSSSNAYKTLKDAKAGLAHTLKVPDTEVTAHYAK